MAFKIIAGVIIFLLGIVLGSFYSLVIYKIPRDIPVFKKSGEGLKLPAAIILLRGGYLNKKGDKATFEKGRDILKANAFIEISAGILFLISWMIFGAGLDFLIHILFWSMLLIIGFIDYFHRIVPDGVLLFFSPFALIYAVLTPGALLYKLFGGIIGFSIYYIIYFVSKKIYKAEAFGFGDVLLMASSGLFLGGGEAVFAAFLSFIIGAAFIAIMKAAKKEISKDMEIPFAPFICAASFISSIWGEHAIKYYMPLFNM